MKWTLKIVIIAATFALLSSCSSDEGNNPGPPVARSTVDIETVIGGAEDEDKLYTVRYLIFDDASTTASLDKNILINVTEENRKATTFKSTIEVNSNPDKMIIAVVNEPDDMTTQLNQAVSPEGIEDMVFNMGSVFTSDNTALKPSRSIPMSGVKRKIAVTEDNTTNVEMNLERSVARVELWLKKEDNLTFARVNTSTGVSLAKSHTEGYLATGTQADGTRFQTGASAADNFGHMLTVQNPATTLNWTYTESSPMELTGTHQLICSFYVPERTCSAANDADKLVLGISKLQTSESERTSAGNVLDKFSEDGGPEQPITEIKRNNIYQVFGTVRSNAVEFSDTKILNWTDAEQGTIIDPQYYIRFSRDNLYLTNLNDQAVINIKTNYDRDDRGFEKGIRMDQISVKYFDKNKNPAAGQMADWLKIQMSGADGDLSRDVTFTAIKALDTANSGYYAAVQVTVANITKTIIVTRS